MPARERDHDEGQATWRGDAFVNGEAAPAFVPAPRQELDPKPDRRSLLDGRRKAEQARNLQTAIVIRDDQGDESAATKTVRLKAASFIQGDEGKPGVTVNVNTTTNVAAISPGYVIRLGRFSQPEALPTIDAAPELLTIDHAEEPAP